MKPKAVPPDIYIAFKALAIGDFSRRHCRVAGAILAHFNTKTGQCDPSGERLASMLGMDRRDVIRATAAVCGKDGLFEKQSHGGKSHRASYSPRWDRFAAIVALWEARMAPDLLPPGTATVETASGPNGGKSPPLTAGKSPPLTGGESPPQTLRRNSLKELCARERDGSLPSGEGHKGLGREGKPGCSRPPFFTTPGFVRNQPSHADAAEAARWRKRADEINRLPTPEERTAAWEQLT